MTAERNKTEEKNPQIENSQLINCKFIDYVLLPENIHQQVYAARISDSIRFQMTNSDIFPYTGHIEFVKSLRNNDSKKYWAFCDNECFIASVCLHPVYWEQRWGEWGIYMNPVYMGKNIARHIAGMFFDYLTENTSIELVKARVKISNTRSINFHERIGFHIVNDNGIYICLENNLKNI
ncbi:MAG: GNAT family N-acetyltransferase [Prevotellaceae bacterium]|jgi:RimJ/RimL family protein N-acetyltransferase|nr:GNAT family N-acetyltransferase [Prevotellaceae bacterium]